MLLRKVKEAKYLKPDTTKIAAECRSMELDWIEILTLLLGSGFVLSIITLVYNWRQSKIERDSR